MIFEKESLMKTSENIKVFPFSLKSIAIKINKIKKVKFVTKLQLFLINTPTIKIIKIDKERNISGYKI